MPPLRSPAKHSPLPLIATIDTMTRLALLAALAAPLTALAGSPEPAIGRLNLAGFNHRQMCTASLIAPDLALTAAHCVTTPEDGYLKHIADMTFVAGWDGEGHTGAAKVASVEVHPEAYKDGRFQLAHDVALVHLATPIAPQPLNIGSATLPGPFTLMGYQKSAPHRLEITSYCYGEDLRTLWRIRCRVEPGQSGGPVMAGEGNARRIAAVIVAVSEENALAVPIDGWLRQRLAVR